MNKRQLELTKYAFVIHFLETWGVATTSAIHLHFSKDFGWSPYTTYQRLRDMEAMGFVRVIKRGKYTLWTLGKKNRETADNQGIRVRAYHDLLVLAAICGDWIDVKHVRGFRYGSRRDDLSDLVDIAQPHRPDGYWKFANTLVTLEVILSGKDLQLTKANLYNSERNIHSTIWLVGSHEIESTISERLRAVGNSATTAHYFLLLKDFLKLGWASGLRSDCKEEITLAQLLTKIKWNNLGTIAEQSRNHCSVLKILDNRHRRFESST